jgi:hypothetical protein
VGNIPKKVFGNLHNVSSFTDPLVQFGRLALKDDLLHFAASCAGPSRSPFLSSFVVVTIEAKKRFFWRWGNLHPQLFPTMGAGRLKGFFGCFPFGTSPVKIPPDSGHGYPLIGIFICPSRQPESSPVVAAQSKTPGFILSRGLTVRSQILNTSPHR